MTFLIYDFFLIMSFFYLQTQRSILKSYCEIISSVIEELHLIFCFKMFYVFCPSGNKNQNYILSPYPNRSWQYKTYFSLNT